VFSSVRIDVGGIDLVLVVVVCIGLIQGHRSALSWGIMTGLALDFVSNAPLGTYTLALATTATLATFSLGLGMEGPVLQGGVVALGTLLYHLLVMIVVQLCGFGASWDLVRAQELLMTAACNAVLAPFMYWIVHGINKRMYSGLKQEIGW
jgi:rod shape-determining protein MreD